MSGQAVQQATQGASEEKKSEEETQVTDSFQVERLGRSNPS